jgi:hypothetical protein
MDTQKPNKKRGKIPSRNASHFANPLPDDRNFVFATPAYTRLELPTFQSAIAFKVGLHECGFGIRL